MKYIAMLVFFLFNYAVAAEDKKKEFTVAYYEIIGVNADDIRRQLNLHGPFDESGKRHDALTKWYVSWNWPEDKNGNADLSKATVSVKVFMIMPKIAAEIHVDKEIDAKWANYCVKLIEHEEKHVKIADECRSQIEKALVKTNEKDAESTANAILKKYKDLEIEMDKVTNHGMNDGVKFP